MIHKKQEFCIQHASGNSKRKKPVEGKRIIVDSSTSEWKTKKKRVRENNNNITITMCSKAESAKTPESGCFRQYPCTVFE